MLFHGLSFRLPPSLCLEYKFTDIKGHGTNTNGSIKIRMSTLALASVALLVGGLSYRQKGCGFDSWSGHIPRSRVWSPVREWMRGDPSMFLSHVYVSFPFFLLLFSLKSMSMSSGEDKKKKDINSSKYLWYVI